ncbi:3-hydroxybutyryl-CoA dehydrogenase [Kineosphaera limosa]|uniref:Putative 3-hydroxyacyl-CoA dehydrogenase n=1 Tax=Kineosphaera limosa NBRC 100340 TaxID=1184609 RepID=K6W903_9MICO|nr:3-hydroxyacyl-CoA dehydrogenase [Kineosphaera limosa]NYD99568.1 3-hydroxybutyryl-CoA dehydrogenase [Kineosphaera limosa]GAB95675.1 putative 3-hydroxyacyl-CoA dehydrogenase [Kineosphaera limosa NBRC 100340]
MAREIKTVAVIGLGTMGAGIVEVFARNGIEVVGIDANEEAVARGRGFLESSTQRGVDRGKLDAAAREEVLSRVTFSADMAALAHVDLVVEAVPERIELKRAIFAQLDEHARPDAILCTNTSSLSVTDIATSTKEPKRVVGMHFFNPATVLRLVEVIRTVITSDEIVEAVVELSKRLGKRPVVVGDRAGFIANALLLGYLNHAATMYENRYAAREDIDAAMTLGCGYPMGPLALLDLIGLDTSYAVLDTMYKQGRDRLHAPTPILKQLITAGLLGRKAGHGFYTYEKPGSGRLVPDAMSALTAEPVAPGEAAPIERVGVVGSGDMAIGIAETIARHGLPVRLIARTSERAAEALDALSKSLHKAEQRGRIEEAEVGAALARIESTAGLDGLRDCQVVIEAIAEDLPAKQAMFENLDEVCAPGTVLATTTAALSVVQCAAATKRPADVLGMHFLSPPQDVDLVEVVSTVSTSPQAVGTATALCERIGKRAVQTADRSGFIVNALLFPYLNDAVKMLETNYASADDIDTAMKDGCGLPMGPFEVLDAIGLDVALSIQRELYLEFRERSLAPAPLLEHLVQAGYLGRKSGRGFRTYV